MIGILLNAVATTIAALLTPSFGMTMAAIWSRHAACRWWSRQRMANGNPLPTARFMFASGSSCSADQY